MTYNVSKLIDALTIPIISTVFFRFSTQFSLLFFSSGLVVRVFGVFKIFPSCHILLDVC